MKDNKEKYKETVINALGYSPMLGSKGRYSFNNPTHIVVFNAKIDVEGIGLLDWKGDIDITRDFDKLRDLANVLNTGLTIVYESKSNGIYHFSYGGFSCSCKDTNKYIEMKDGVPHFKKIESEPKKEVFDEEYDTSGKYKEEDFYAIDCDINKFKSNEDKGPLAKLYDAIVLAKDTFLPKTKLSISDVYMTKNDQKKIKEFYGEWLVGHHGYDPEGYDYNKEMSWLTIDMPAEFYGKSEKGPKWAVDGKIYIRKDVK